MAKRRPTASRLTTRTVVTPFSDLDFAEGDDGLSFWKQLLPEASIEYVDASGQQTLTFDEEYERDLIDAFEDRALDAVPFVLADESNRHTMDPERFRGKLVDMKRAADLPETVTKGKPGLWGKITFPKRKMARAVLDNPELPVSMRIREGHTRARDGKQFKRVAVHVLGTLDPKITGMAGWTPALDFSGYAPGEHVVDLTASTYREIAVAKNKGKGGSRTLDFATLTEDEISDLTPEDIGSMTAEDFVAIGEDEDAADTYIENLDTDALEAFIARAIEEGIVTQEELDALRDDNDEDNDEDDDKGKPAGKPKAKPAKATRETELSTSTNRDIQLANAAAEESRQIARDALQRVADTEAARLSAEYLAAGVPPKCIELAMPILRQPNMLDIELSNSDEDDIPISRIVLGLLDEMKGSIDLSVENGHEGANAGDDAELDAMDKQFNSSFTHL